MRPKSFITIQERKDYEKLTMDLKNGRVDRSSINNIISHIIKNRTQYKAQVDPKYLV